MQGISDVHSRRSAPSNFLGVFWPLWSFPNAANFLFIEGEAEKEGKKNEPVGDGRVEPTLFFSCLPPIISSLYRRELSVKRREVLYFLQHQGAEPRR